MKNLIYQVWAGNLTEECRVSSKLMKQYANRIGAEYLLHMNPNIASKLVDGNGPYWEWLNPIIDDSFLEYDNVLIVDLDVFPVEGLEENIFDQDIKDVGVCTEPIQGKLRSSVTIANHINKTNDEKWVKHINANWDGNPFIFPRDGDGHLKIYNAGVVLFSNKGMKRARTWTPFQNYIDIMKKANLGRFYTVDQNYFHAMLFIHGMDFVEMDNGWNEQVHFIRGPMSIANPIHDPRNENTKLVHVQLSGIQWNEKDLYTVVNEPQSKWSFIK